LETDSIRAAGDSTVVDLWIEGKLRALTIPRSAIEAYLPLARHNAVAMTDSDRCEFVRKNLGLIARAVTARLRTDRTATAVCIEPGQLVRES